MIYFVAPYEVEGVSSVDPQYVLDYFEHKTAYKSIQLDTETNSFCPHVGNLITIQLGDKQNQFVIDVRYVNILLFQDLIQNSLCLLHNAKFDYKFFKKKGIMLERVWDTMLVENVIFNGYDSKERGLGLEAVVWNYLKVRLEKETRNSFAGMTDQFLTLRQIEYAAQDVRHLHDVATFQHKLVNQFDYHYAVGVENEVFKAIGDIEYNGMKLDRDKWLKLARSNKKKLDIIKKELDEIILSDKVLKEIYRPSGVMNLFGYYERQLDINYNSTAQIKKLLHNRSVFVPDTNMSTLKRYSKKHPIVGKIIEHRKLAKLVSTYGEKFLNNINPVTGRVHTEFWQIRHTFRLSSGNKDTGAPNLQNIPKDNEFRNCFVAEEGYKWFSSDYSGQEMRLMADFSGETKLIDAINRGDDAHCFAYKEMTGEVITKQDSDKRDKAKNINFMKPYGGGPEKMSLMMGIPLAEAERNFELYAKAFPILEKYLQRNGEFGKKNMYNITNSIHKGRRWFPMINYTREARKETYPDWSFIMTHEGSAERESMNFPIQGTGAVMMKEALIEARLIVDPYRARLISTVHDELSVEVPDDVVPDLQEEVEQAMKDVGNKYVTKVSMDVDSVVADFWTKGE